MIYRITESNFPLIQGPDTGNVIYIILEDTKNTNVDSHCGNSLVRNYHQPYLNSMIIVNWRSGKYCELYNKYGACDEY